MSNPIENTSEMPYERYGSCSIWIEDILKELEDAHHTMMASINRLPEESNFGNIEHKEDREQA